MSTYSKFLSLINGVARTIDLSTNTLSLGALQLNGSISGTFTQQANATTTSYSVTWPAAQASGTKNLQNDGAGNLTWASGSAGTVSSVALADGSTSPIYTITNSPVTSSGTLTFTLNAQSANSVFAGPTTGAATQPGFRALVVADIPSLSSLYLSLTGGTMSGAINMGSNKITSLASGSSTNDAVNYGQVILASGANAWTANQDLGGNLITGSGAPINPNDLVRKVYVDNLFQGISWKNIVRSATTGVLNDTPTYSNGASGVGATLTGTTGVAIAAQDGVTLVSGDRLLVKNQASSLQNGIYTVTTVGGSSVNYVLTRALDCDDPTEFVGATVEIGTEASTQSKYLYFQNTAAPITVGTTAISWIQISNALIYSFTSGVQIVGSVVSANVDNSTIDVNGSNQLEVKAAGITSTQLASASVTTAKLGTITDGVTLDQSGAGSTLEIKPAGVGTTQLANSSVTAAKLGSVTDGTTLDQSGAGSTIEIKPAGVSATQLNTGAFDQTTIVGGAGTVASVAYAPAVKRVLVAGQSFSANTSYAVRWGITANSESSDRIYAADITTSSFDLFYVIGMASSGTSVSAGQNINVTIHGAFNLSSSDSAFGSNTDGDAVYLTASGTFSLTAPSTSGQAVTRIGIVEARSATVASNVIGVNPQVVGVN